MIGFNSSRRGTVAHRALAVLLLLPALLWSLTDPPLPARREATATSAPSTKPIEAIRLGERLAGVNPLREQAETVEPDQLTWREIHLRVLKADGTPLEVYLLRPVTWLEAEQAEVGRTVFLDLPEMGAVGHAEVLAILDCPPIASGKGTVVTGKFVHQANGTNVMRLSLEGQAQPTGVTKNHPYWSVDRQAFVPAGELQVGEQVDTVQGAIRVASIAPDDYRGKLYNLETGEHVYRVGAVGTLVHNSCPKRVVPGPKAGDDLYVGFYGEAYRANRKTGLGATHTPHHTVQHAVSETSHNLGVTITLRKDIHEATRSYKKNADLGNNVSNLAADIWQLRRLLKQAAYDRSLVNQQMKRLIELNRKVGNVP